MKIHEYQSKEILRQYAVPTPRGKVCFTVDEAAKAAADLGGTVWVVKAQIHAGGRGKGGGVKVARSAEEVRKLAGEILGMQLVTHQTGSEGQEVRRLLIEEGAQILKEYYVAMVIDRSRQCVVLMASSEGGMDIEEVAAKSPEKIHKVWIDPSAGLLDGDADKIARKNRHAGCGNRSGQELLAGLISGLCGKRCHACRNQSAGHDSRQRCDRVGCEDEF